MESLSDRWIAAQTATEYEQHSGRLTPRRASLRSESPQSHPNSVAPSPKTVLLGLWPGTQSRQIDYYVQGYRTVYPSANVVLLHPSRTPSKHIDSVLHTLAGDVEKVSDTPRRDILIHLFGDKAATQVCRLLRTYRTRTQQPLGVRSLILDSVPVAVAPSYKALRSEPLQLPIFVCLLITAVLSRLASVLMFWFVEPFGTQVNRDLLNPELLPADARRCYIFPEKGIMFAWDRPSSEGEACERQEFLVKSRSIDGRERWTGDQERYWLGIENAWEGR